jgi:hypothetical protein
MEAIIVFIAVALFLVAVTTLGADTRDGNDWIWHSRP